MFIIKGAIRNLKLVKLRAIYIGSNLFVLWE
jgi:hypothetical protein